jgi:hypothetical protein
MAWRLAVLPVAFDTSITGHLALILNPPLLCRSIPKCAANHDGLEGEISHPFVIRRAVKRTLQSRGATALVAGGSLAGLAAGLELRAAGPRVSIHERSQRVPDDRGARHCVGFQSGRQVVGVEILNLSKRFGKMSERWLCLADGLTTAAQERLNSSACVIEREKVKLETAIPL